MPGLMWLSEPEYASAPWCLTFVRGAGESAVFGGFGADPAEAVSARLRDRPWPQPEPVVYVARSAGGLVAIEDNIPPQGTRAEVLRRLSAGGEAVALYHDIGKGDHAFAYAADGDVVCGVITAVPPHWYGSNPDAIAARVRELGPGGDFDDDDLTDWEILLTLAQERFGLSMEEEDLDRPWPAARILPLLAELPAPPTAKLGIGDPVVDLLLDHATEQTLRSVTSLRIGRLLEESGLAGYPELVSAARRIAAEPRQQVHDHDPVGLLLRRLQREADRGDHDLAVGRNMPGFSEGATRERIRRGKVARTLEFALAGRHLQALVNEMLLQLASHPQTWHQQAVDDLAAVEVPAADMEAAQRSWESTRHLPDPRIPTGTDSVREHIQRLLDSGMDKGRIAELAGWTTGGIDMIMAGHVKVLPGLTARKFLLIEPS